MPKVEVTLYCEQRATVVVDMPDPGDGGRFDTKDLHRAALEKLDESHGLEWVSESGWVDTWRTLEDTP